MAKEFTSVAYGALSSTDTKLMVEAAATETLNYSKIRLQEMKKMVDDGNYSWRIGGLISGFVICTLSFLEFFSKIFSLSPFAAVLDIYIFVGGVIAIVLELKERCLTQKYLDMLNREALFLSRPYGRAAFYFFIGILMSCQGSLLSLIGGLGVAFVGAIIFLGSRKAYDALNKMKASTFDRASVIEKFDQFDKDKNGHLDTIELSALCLSLGSTLSKNELESALFILDKNQDGKIEKQEFIDWWQGKDDPFV